MSTVVASDQQGSINMAEINSDERVVVAKSNVNVANIILAITVLIVALGALKYFGMLPF
jgi:hypothetical protein